MSAISTLLLLTSALQPSAEVLPGLALLGHQVKILPAEGSALIDAPDADLILVDGRQELAHARDLCRLLRTTGLAAPLIAVVTEGGLAAISAEWGIDEMLMPSAGPAEVEARLRLLIGRVATAAQDVPDDGVVRAGDRIREHLL